MLSSALVTVRNIKKYKIRNEMKKYVLVTAALLLADLPAMSSFAQTTQQTIIIQNGAVVNRNGGPVQIAITEEQKLMFEAPKYVFHQEYKAAEAIYTRVLGMNPSNSEAYIQRGLVRREIADTAGATADGRAAVIISNNALSANPNNASLYYERSMGFRLLKQFEQARKDMQIAIQLSGNTTWDTDMKAIDLEQKIAMSQQ